MATQKVTKLLEFFGFKNEKRKLTPKEIMELFEIAVKMRSQKIDPELIISSVKAALNKDAWGVFIYLKIWKGESEKKIKSKLMDDVRSMLAKIAKDEEQEKVVEIKAQDKQLIRLHLKEFKSALRALVKQRLPRGLRELGEKADLTEAALSRLFSEEKEIMPRQSSLKDIYKALDIESVTIRLGEGTKWP